MKFTVSFCSWAKLLVWKWLPKRKQCIDSSNNTFFSSGLLVFFGFWLGLLCFVSDASVFYGKLSSSGFKIWNFRECTSPFPSLDLNMFSPEVCCLKIVCVVNQQEIALVIDKSTRLSKFYKSKNTHCRCDMSQPLVLSHNWECFCSHCFAGICSVLCGK